MDPLMTGTLQSQVTQVRTLKSIMNKDFTDLGTCMDYFVRPIKICESSNFCFPV
jgi:hypothetical protein